MTAVAPTLYLVTVSSGRELRAFGAGLPTLRLAYNPGPALYYHWEDDPALLVSFVYLKPFLDRRPQYRYRTWAMDSGAFSAQRSGTPVDLVEYTETCRELLATDPTLAEVFALDVIGDWRASLKNTEAMWKAGVPAIPCFHVGEPEDALVGMARDYPKIALGGAVGLRPKPKKAWTAQCFACIWPKAVHGFGFGAEWALMDFPFHSVDATSWESPNRFGNWRAFDGARVSVRGSHQNLRAEVRWFLALEGRARQKWAALWAKHPTLIDALPREVPA